MLNMKAIAFNLANRYQGGYMKRTIGIISAIAIFLAAIILVLINPLTSQTVTETATGGLRQVQQYNFSINILAMLLIGFGFLMVFIKNYGYSATTGTYIVVGAGLPLYLLLRATGILSAEAVPADSIHALLLAEFAVAAALIAMGAVLGRLRIYQYALLSIILVPCYMLNEWLVLDGGLGITKGFIDSAGSIVIHTFGAYFGLGLTIALTKAKQFEKAIECDATSDRFACSARWYSGSSGPASARPSFRKVM
jgi:ammonium transporter Rh